MSIIYEANCNSCSYSGTSTSALIKYCIECGGKMNYKPIVPQVVNEIRKTQFVDRTAQPKDKESNNGR